MASDGIHRVRQGGGCAMVVARVGSAVARVRVVMECLECSGAICGIDCPRSIVLYWHAIILHAYLSDCSVISLSSCAKEEVVAGVLFQGMIPNASMHVLTRHAGYVAVGIVNSSRKWFASR